MITIVGLIIGILLFGAGVYYLQQNKNDAESRKIYGVRLPLVQWWPWYAR